MQETVKVDYTLPDPLKRVLKRDPTLPDVSKYSLSPEKPIKI